MPKFEVRLSKLLSASYLVIAEDEDAAYSKAVSDCDTDNFPENFDPDYDDAWEVVDVLEVK